MHIFISNFGFAQILSIFPPIPTRAEASDVITIFFKTGLFRTPIIQGKISTDIKLLNSSEISSRFRTKSLYSSVYFGSERIGFCFLAAAREEFAWAESFNSPRFAENHGKTIAKLVEYGLS